MAKLRKDVEVKIGDDGKIILKEPSNHEWNDFVAKRYPLSKGNRLKDNSSEARVELFDKLVVEIENIEDEKGLITLETKERIPARLKAEIIFKAFESEETVEIKN